MGGVLILVVGPTASGKTDTAIRLAEWLGTEIVSADARQFYREMSIGTARPDPMQLSRVNHHFIGHRSIFDPYDAADFEKDSDTLLADLFSRYSTVVLTGGSGLYIRAACHGLDPMPGRDPAIRDDLMRKFHLYGLRFLQEELKSKDPEYFNRVDLSNPARLIRALEVCLASGVPYSKFRGQTPKDKGYRIITIGLDIPRVELGDRIDRRLELMLNAGLVEEARGLFPYRHLQALQTVGYRELFRYFDGEISLEEAVGLIRTNTRHYAKRQMTWFRKEKVDRWIHPSGFGEIQSVIESLMAGC
jgi:tRNA dimethylallyltransferase